MIDEYLKMMHLLQNEDFDFEEGSNEEGQDGCAEDPVEFTTGFKAVRQKAASHSSAQDVNRDAQSVQKLLNEYNKLEYEDIIAGMPTKFHYKQVIH